MNIKLRKQGNSYILTVPKEINTNNYTEYTVSQDNAGRIIYEPTGETNYDIWKDPKYDNLDYDELLKQDYKDLGYNPCEVKPLGKELTDEN